MIGKMRFFALDGISRKALIGLFLLKIGAGIVLTLIYTYHYTYRDTSDAFRYFDDAAVLYGALIESPMDYLRMLTGIGGEAPHLQVYYDQMLRWSRGFGDQLYNDNRTIIRFNALLYLFSTGHYHVHTVFMCFLSFTGLTAIYKTFYPFLSHLRKGLAAAVFLVPSVLFWGSGVLKEGIVLFALGLLVWHFHRVFLQRGHRRSLPWLLLFAGILLLLKYYVLFALLPSLCVAIWGLRSTEVPQWLKYAFILLSFFLAVISTRWLLPGHDVLKTLSVKQADFINLARGGIYLTSDKHLIYIKPENREHVISLGTDSTFKIRPGNSFDYWSVNDVSHKMEMTGYNDTITYKLAWDFPPAGSRIDLPQLDPGVWSFVKNLPNALLNSFFRPHLFEASSPFMLMAALENTAIVLLIVLCLVFPNRRSDLSMAWFCLCFVFVLFSLIGLLTPVLGALVRYKVPALPFLFIALLMLCDWKKVFGRMPWLRRLLN